MTQFLVISDTSNQILYENSKLNNLKVFDLFLQLFTSYIRIINKLTLSDECNINIYIYLILCTAMFVFLIFVILNSLKYLINIILYIIKSSIIFLKNVSNDENSLLYKIIEDSVNLFHKAGTNIFKNVPWYFNLLMLILIFCGLASLFIDNGAWIESFKYILGATVGSLIGIAEKKPNEKNSSNNGSE